MGKRKPKLSALGDRTRRPWALPHVKRKQAAAEREALAKLTPEQRERQLQRLREAQALLGGEA
jgi:hypothetical protein